MVNHGYAAEKIRMAVYKNIHCGYKVRNGNNTYRIKAI